MEEENQCSMGHLHDNNVVVGVVQPTDGKLFY